MVQWRALQITTVPPFLPGFEQLRALFPGTEHRACAAVVPLGMHSPEEVLAQCLAIGLQITSSKVIYCRGPTQFPN
jgi:hypothetical protein